MTNTDARLRAIKRSLRYLFVRDYRRKVFGSNKHNYISIKCLRSSLDRFEEKCHVEIPYDFRCFLSSVGHGAGPAYGLMGVGAISKDLVNKADFESRSHEFVPGAEFPLTRVDIEDSHRRHDADDDSSAIELPYPQQGCMPICYHGCTYYTVLVTTGELCGTVLEFNEGGFYMPSFRPAARTDLGADRKKLPDLDPAATFLDWYESWIERCIVDLGTKRVRTADETL